MKLINIQVKSLESHGLESDLLEFAPEITQLYGPNGCGKTPLIESIAFCLGYECKFRDDIYRSCKEVSLSFEHFGNIYTSTRTYTSEFYIVLTNESKKISRFYNEKDFSEYMLTLLGLNNPLLVTLNNSSSSAYLSNILPLFYLDQDHGYSKYYYSPSNFIKDQFSEMIRIIYGFSEKNSYENKKKQLESKRELNILDELVSVNKKNLDSAEDVIQQKTINLDIVNAEILQLSSQLDELKNFNSNKNDALSTIDNIIYGYKSHLKEIDFQIDDIRKRNESIYSIIHEIQIETNTLNLNEEAKKIFRSFNEICQSNNCKMFMLSTESYGKSLLYLKDQIKDLERNRGLGDSRLKELLSEKEIIVTSINNSTKIRNTVVGENDLGAIIQTITQITNRIFRLELDKNDLEQLNTLKDRYFEVLTKRDLALDKYEALKTTGIRNPIIIKMKSELRKVFKKWLAVTNIANVSNDISFKDDFIPLLGEEGLEQLKGSTKVRAILAYKASLIELISEFNTMAFEFIILDTPKQHETHNVDLDSYIKALKELAHNKNIQIIFSSTEYLFPGNDLDIQWHPKYPGEKHLMFLRPKLQSL